MLRFELAPPKQAPVFCFLTSEAMRNGKSSTTITVIMVCYQMDIPDSRSKSSFILCTFTCSRVMPFYFDGK